MRFPLQTLGLVLALAHPAAAQQAGRDGGTDLLVKGGELLGTGAARVTQGVGKALTKEGETTGVAVGEGTGKLADGLIKGLGKGLGAKGGAAPSRPPALDEVVIDESLTSLGVKGARLSRRPDGVRVELLLAKELATGLAVVAFDTAGKVVGRATRDTQKLLDGDSLTFSFAVEVDLNKAAWFRLQ